jgi:hypothetical protein
MLESHYPERRYKNVPQNYQQLLPRSHVETMERRETEAKKDSKYNETEGCHWSFEDVSYFNDEDLSEETECPDC